MVQIIFFDVVMQYFNKLQLSIDLDFLVKKAEFKFPFACMVS